MLSPSDLIGPDGRAIETAMLAGVEVRWSSLVTRGEGASPGGACGRCLTTVAGDRGIVHPGDLCPLPGAARAIPWPTSAAAGADVRGEIALAWPGACPCAPLERGGAGADGDTPEQVDPPGPEAVAFDLFARAGPTVAAFTSLGRAALWTLAEGPRPAQIDPPLEDPSVTEKVRIRSAVGLEDGRFVLQVTRQADDGVDSGGSVLLLDSNLRQLGETTEAAPTLPRGLVPLRGGLVVQLGGETIPPGIRVPLAVCSIDRDRPVCGAINIRSFWGTMLAARFAGGTELDSGIVVLASAGHGVAYFERFVPPGRFGQPVIERTDEGLGIMRGVMPVDGGAPLRWTIKQIDPSDLPPRAVIKTIGRAGDRIVLCAQDHAHGFDSDVRVLTASITASVFDSIDAGRRFETIACVKRRRCGGFLPRATEEPGVRVLLDGGESFEIDPSGALAAGARGDVGACDSIPAPADLPGVDRPVVRGFRSGAVSFVETHDGALFSRAPAAPAFVRVFGRSEPLSNAPRALIERAGQALVLEPGGSLGRIDPGTSAPGTARLVERVSLPGFDPQDVTLAAVADRQRGDVVLLGECRGAGGALCGAGSWIRRVDLDSLRVEEVALGAAANTTLLGIAEVSPGRQIAIGARSIFALDGSDLEPVPFEWDDPATSERETEPPPDPECLLRRSTDPRPSPEEDLFRGVEAGSGVAWVFGCRSTLIRVDARGARRIAPERAVPTVRFADSDEPVALLGARATCPDSVIFSVARRHDFKDAFGSGSIVVELTGDRFEVSSEVFVRMGWAGPTFGSTGVGALVWDPDSGIRPAGRVIDLPAFASGFRSPEPLEAVVSVGKKVVVVSAHGRVTVLSLVANGR